MPVTRASIPDPSSRAGGLTVRSRHDSAPLLTTISLTSPPIEVDDVAGAGLGAVGDDAAGRASKSLRGNAPDASRSSVPRGSLTATRPTTTRNGPDAAAPWAPPPG